MVLSVKKAVLAKAAKASKHYTFHGFVEKNSNSIFSLSEARYKLSMQKNIFSFVLVTFAQFSISAFAQTQAAGWAAYAEAYVKTLSRPIDIYTWEPRASFQSVPGEIVQPQDPRASQLLTNYANLFNDPKAALTYEGPNGVYFATDPFVSREWGSNQAPNFVGGREWSVIRVTLPVGTRFFDGRMDNSFPQPLQQFVVSKGCSANSMRQLLNVRSRGDRQQCWVAYTEMARVMKIQALAKYFYAVAPDYCANHNTFITDFIVIDPDAMRNYAVYTAEIPVNDAKNEERFFIRDFISIAKSAVERRCGAGGSDWSSRFNGAACNFYSTSPARYELPWNLPLGDLASPVLRQKIENKIFGCGNYSEDRP